MNKDEINDLLSSINPDLITGYETKNLDGKTLKSIIAEYDLQEAKVRKYRKLGLISILVTVTVPTLVFYSILLKTESIEIALSVIFAGFLLLWFCFLQPSIDKSWECSRKLHDCEKILEDFKQSVLALNPLTESAVNYDKESVRLSLVSLAGRKHDAEVRFQDACRRFVSAKEIVPVANSLIECDKQLEITLSAAEKFGLTFNTKELFAEARAIRILDKAMPTFER